MDVIRGMRVFLAGARRFVLLLGGARAGSWRWLIAVLVASLVSVPVAVAATPIGRAPAVRGPVARAASLESLALSLVTKLGEGAVTKVGSEGFGWVLDQFGLGNGNGLDSEIAGIRSQLEDIQNRLTALQTAVTQLRGDVAQSEYSVLAGQTTTITGNINHAMTQLDDIARWTGTVNQRKNFTKKTMAWIGDKLMGGEQEDLAEQISGALGADGLIKAFSKAMKARSPYWTSRTSERVREVFDYYQLEEARLLIVRVEYMHAKRDTYPADLIKTDIDRVKQQLDRQAKDLLKPSPPDYEIADTRTDLLWSTYEVGNPFCKKEGVRGDACLYTFAQAQKRVGDFTTSSEEARLWRLPTVDEVLGLIAGWPEGRCLADDGDDWGQWLGKQVGLRIPVSEGVWTNQAASANSHWTVSLCGPAIIYNDAGTAGLLQVSHRTETYWW